MFDSFGWGGFVLRLFFALVLVSATYNPTGMSFYHWALVGLLGFGPEQAVAGIVLLIGWVVYLRATLRSLGPIGIALAMALFAALVWLLVSRGLLSPDDPRVIEYVVLVALALILAVGMSWSFIRRRLSGQMDVDDVEC